MIMIAVVIVIVSYCRVEQKDHSMRATDLLKKHNIRCLFSSSGVAVDVAVAVAVSVSVAVDPTTTVTAIAIVSLHACLLFISIL